MGDLFSLGTLRAHVGYTGRFVVGRGHWWSLGCGLQPMKFCGIPIPSSLALGVGALSGRGAGVGRCLRVVPRSPGFKSGEHCAVTPRCEIEHLPIVSSYGAGITDQLAKLLKKKLQGYCRVRRTPPPAYEFCFATSQLRRGLGTQDGEHLLGGHVLVLHHLVRVRVRVRVRFRVSSSA
eukprot:scaffold6179_cov50-Phaeocystis_antarctica.AAC.2